ncbi:MAG: hypothetical protein AB4063_23470 [Crocosphaera sp.]
MSPSFLKNKAIAGTLQLRQRLERNGNPITFRRDLTLSANHSIRMNHFFN